MAIALSDLLAGITEEEALQAELDVATSLGLAVTAWQPVSVARTIYQTMAVIIANQSEDVANIAAGGFATTAAALPTTGWMDLVSEEVYAVTRIPASYAALDSTEFTVTNASGSTQGPFAVGQFIVSNPVTGAEYANTAVVTLAVGANGVAIQALVAGAASTSGPGTITNVVTAIVGVTCTNSASAVGSDAETNSALLVRDQAKLGALSPNGPAQAYYFVATSILDSTQPFYNPALTEPITRVATISSPARVEVYLANAAGPPSGPDVVIVDAAIQQWAVPLGVTATVAAAGSTTVNITSTCYVPTAAGLSTLQVQTAVSDALATYFEALPIGGITDATAHVVPIGGIQGVIYQAIAALSPTYAPQMSVTLTLPATDTSVGATDVPVLGSVTTNVVVTT